MSRTALVAGYSGLVGRHLIDALLREDGYARIKAVGRRAPTQAAPQIEWIESTLGDLKSLRPRLQADDAYCCLGTTLRAAGSRAAFERVDFHMVVEFARTAHACGARRFFLVSALSAAPRSPVFYSRVKGRAEQAVRDIGFDAVHIVRPSLLLGARQEHRAGEALGQRLAPLINPFLHGGLAKYRAVRGEDVAAALVKLSRREDRGAFVHTLPLPA